MKRLALLTTLALSTACATGGAGSCSVSTSESGEVTLSCPDGDEAILEPGRDGARGNSGHNGFTLNGKLEGNLVLLKPGDCEGLEGLTEVTGALTVMGTPCKELALPKLKRIGGALVVSNISMSIPIVIESISLPALTSVGGAAVVSDLPELSQLDLSHLETVGDALDEADALTDGRLIVHNLPKLTTLDLSALHTAAGPAIFGLLPVVSNLDTLAGLERVGGSLDITQNNLLDSLDLSGLQSVGSTVNIDANPSLCQSKVDAVIDALEALGWTEAAASSISGNKGGC